MSSVKCTVENFDIYVKPEFLTKVEIEKFGMLDLIKDHDLFSNLHNENGPAIVNLDNGEVNYVINGAIATEEQIERIKHNNQFNSNLTTILKEEKTHE